MTPGAIHAQDPYFAHLTLLEIPDRIVERGGSKV
jgi:hypothetical protein